MRTYFFSSTFTHRLAAGSCQRTTPVGVAISDLGVSASNLRHLSFFPFFTAVSIPKHPYPRHATRLCVFIYLYTPPSPSQIRFTNSVGMLETKPPRPCGAFVFQAITLAGTRAVLFWYDEIPKCEVPVVFEAFPSGFETAICNLTKWTCFWFKSFQ